MFYTFLFVIQEKKSSTFLSTVHGMES